MVTAGSLFGKTRGAVKRGIRLIPRDDMMYIWRTGRCQEMGEQCAAMRLPTGAA